MHVIQVDIILVKQQGLLGFAYHLKVNWNLFQINKQVLYTRLSVEFGGMETAGMAENKPKYIQTNSFIPQDYLYRPRPSYNIRPTWVNIVTIN